MRTNWKSTVAKLNRKTYAWPAGWSTREQVAEELECSPERVSEILAPGIRLGDIEKGSFPVWDERLQRKVMVIGYRERKTSEEPVRETFTPTPTLKRGPGRPPKRNPIVNRTYKPGDRVTSIRRGTLGTFQEGGIIKWDSGNVSRPGERTLREDIDLV
jgi:hypothetical protein